MAGIADIQNSKLETRKTRRYAPLEPSFDFLLQQSTIVNQESPMFRATVSMPSESKY
jgi:hypothetical protein